MVKDTSGDMDNLGAQIRKLRELRNLSRKEMADGLMISLNSYGKIERNEVELTVKRLREISVVLDVKISTILDFDGHAAFENGLWRK